MAKAAAQKSPRNAPDSEKYAEAMALYESDKGVVDRANGLKRRHQNYFEQEHGISAKEIRRRYAESKLTRAERAAQFAEEQIGRRALDLWSAETGDDFDELMARATATPTASGEGADKLAAARSYNDAFNGAAHGDQTQADNPHLPGTDLQVQWSRGCADGLDYKETFLNGAAPRVITTDDEDNHNLPEVPKKRGRSRKAAPEQPAEPPTAEPNIFDEAPSELPV